MNCIFLKKINSQTNSCSLGFYGGFPSNGVCKTCIEKKENTKEFADELFARADKAHPANRKRISGCCDRADQA